MRPSVRRTLVLAVKLTLALGILAYLIVNARSGFAKLAEQPIYWPLVVAGLLCTFVAAMLSFLRWHLLIRAQSIVVSLPQTFGLGALGMALNYVSLGSIGGDFFKAVFLAHGQPGRRTEAVATVVADRVMGLLTMLSLASGGILASGLMSSTSVPVRILCRTILVSTAICWVGVGVLLLFPPLTGERVRRRAARLPIVGATISRLLGTAQAFRMEWRTLLTAFGISIVMALCVVTSLYLIARGLPVDEPTWSEHLVIVPTAGLVGAIPITPSGLGTTEAAVEKLYQTMPGGDGHRQGDGTMVAMARRVTEMTVAAIGLIIYFVHWRKFREVYAEAEAAADAEEAGELA